MDTLYIIYFVAFCEVLCRTIGTKLIITLGFIEPMRFFTSWRVVSAFDFEVVTCHKCRVTIRPDLGGTVPLFQALSRCPALTMESPGFSFCQPELN